MQAHRWSRVRGSQRRGLRRFLRHVRARGRRERTSVDAVAVALVGASLPSRRTAWRHARLVRRRWWGSARHVARYPCRGPVGLGRPADTRSRARSEEFASPNNRLELTKRKPCRWVSKVGFHHSPALRSSTVCYASGVEGPVAVRRVMRHVEAWIGSSRRVASGVANGVSSPFPPSTRASRVSSPVPRTAVRRRRSVGGYVSRAR